ncbi:hypothetical protein ASE26_20065 [Duganella sp. Root198D2]|nr:hypothetical protein ASE26_20065 [Duganella sp. Root198D2]
MAAAPVIILGPLYGAHSRKGLLIRTAMPAWNASLGYRTALLEAGLMGETDARAHGQAWPAN